MFKPKPKGPLIRVWLTRLRSGILRLHVSTAVKVVLFVVALTGVFLYTRAGVPTRVEAATSDTLNFQARLLNGSGAIVPDGDYNVEFKLYDSATVVGTPDQGACSRNGGTAEPTCLWVETRTGANKVTVRAGYISVHLGDVSSFPGTINWSHDLYLVMNIGGVSSPSWDGEMTPRLKLTSVPFAFAAGSLAQESGGNLGQLSFGGVSNNPDIKLPNVAGTNNVVLQSGTTLLTQGSVPFIDANGRLTQDNSNFFYDATNHRLGLGVNNPATVLDISGAFTQRGTTSPGNSVAGEGIIYFDSSSNKFRVSQNNGNYFDLCTTAGNCSGTGGGITGAGTQNRIAYFDTSGSHIGDSYILQGTGTLTIDDDVDFTVDATDSTFFVDGTNNFVGIGTLAPSTILDVNGTVTVRGQASAPAVSNNDEGTIYYDSATDKFRVSQSGAAYQDICTTAGNCAGTGGGITGSGSQYRVAYFDTSGSHIGSSFLLQDNTAGNLAIDDDKDFIVDAANDTFIVDAHNDAVGIGTNLPGFKLDVNGDINGTAFRLGGYNALTNTSSALELGKDTNWQSLGLFTNNTERLSIDSTGRVGIGVTTPTAQLTVTAPNQSAVGTSAIAVLTVTGGQGGSAGAGQTAGNGSVIGLTSGAGGSATASTATPGTGGAINITSGAGGSGNSTSTNGNGGTITIQGGAPGTGGSGTAGKYGDLILQGTGGNVGIGTSGTPSALLSVGGTTGTFTVTSSGVVTISASGTGLTVDNATTLKGQVTLGVASTSAGSLAFQNGSNANVVTLNSGVTSASYNLYLPTAIGATGDCVLLTSGGQLAFGDCANGQGTAFLQGGNNFGSTTAGTLGTINNGVLNFITNNGTKLTLDTSGNLIFAQASTISTTSGALTLAPTSGSNLNVNLAGAGDFAVNTDQLYVDTSTGFVGIGTSTPAVELDVVGDGAFTGDLASDTLTVATDGSFGGNLTVTGTASVTGTSSLVGAVTLGNDAATPVPGQLIFHDNTAANTSTLTLLTDTDLGASPITVTLPKPTSGTTGIVCYQGDTACGFLSTGSASGFVSLAPVSAQADNTNNSSIFINKGAVNTGNLIQLQSNGVDKFVVDYQGNASVAGTLSVTGTSTFTSLSTFNGGVSVANNSDFSQTGTGTFGTGSGAVSLNGATTVTGTNTFTVNGGLTTLSAGLTAEGTINLNATGAAATNVSTGTGSTVIGNATGSLTLNGSSIILGTATVTRTAAGTTTFDFVDASNTTLAITNSGAGNANLTVDGTVTAAQGLTVSAGGANITGTLAVTGDLTFATGATRNVSIGQQTGSNAGNQLNVSAGQGGSGGANGGTLSLTGGAAGGAGNNNGGDVTISGGGKTGTGTVGNVVIQGTVTVDAAGAISGATGLTSSGNINFASLNAGGLVKAAATTGQLSIATPGTDYETGLTFTNGLTRTSNTVSLGGNLTGATTLGMNGNSLTFDGSTGDVVITATGAATFGNGLSVTAGGASIVGTTDINTGTSASATNIGNSNSTTTVLGTVNINNSGAGTTNVGTGTGSTTVGNSTGTLTLQGASIVLNSATLSRTAAGTTTLDLVDGSNTTFALTNSGAGVANLTTDGSITATGNVSGAVINATTGFQVGGAAATGQYLRGNGTNFVSSALLASDLSGTIFNLSGDANAGTNTVVTGATININGGTNGVDTSLNGNTYTINLDTTEIASATFGAGSGFTWTFDASAGVDPTIAFANDTLTVTSGTSAFTGAVTVSNGLTVSAGGASITGTTGINTGTSASATNIGNANSTTTILGTVNINNSGAGTTNVGTGTGNTTVGNTTGSLTLQGASIVLNSATLSRTASGTTTLDLVDGSNTTFALTNSGAGVANLTTDGSITATGNVTGAVINAVTGFQVNGAATTGNYLRGNGTNFVASSLLASDLSGTIFSTGSDSSTGTNTIVAGDTLNINGGTNGIDTVLNNDTYTLSLDTTEIATSTFGSGSGFTWTFDASAGVDTTLAFGNNTLTVGAATTTFNGQAVFSGATTDITTGTNEDLTLVANGTGKVVINDSLQVTSLGAGLVKSDGSGNISIATAGTDYENALTFANGLTRTGNAVALGGNLTGATSIGLNGNALTFTGSTGNVQFASTGAASFGNGITVSAGGAAITGNSTIAGTLSSLTGLTSSGTITFSGLTPDRLVATTTGGQLTNSISAANLAASVTGTTGTGNLVFSASPTFTGTVTAADITASGTVSTVTLSVSGNATVGGTLGVTGTTTLSGDLAANGNTTIGNATTDRLTITSQLTGASPLVFQGATNDGNTTTFAFQDPTGTNTITFGDETGTVCTTAVSAACSAVYAAAGGAFVSLQPSTPGTPQTGHLNISGTAIVGALTVNNNATVTGDLAVNGGDITSTTALNVTASNGALTFTSTGAGNDVVINSADTIELQDNTNITGDLTVTSNIDTNGTLTVGNSNQFTVNATGAITAATGITSSGTITFSGLTADRLVATTTGGQLTNTITAANLAASVTGTTGTGNLVFSAGPTFTGTVTTAAISATTVSTSGIITVGTLGTANTDTVLCRNSTNQISDCNSTFAANPASGSFIKQVPTTTAENTITPTANSVVGLTVNGTSGTAATAASIVQAGGALALNITSSNTGDGQNINLTNTSGTQTNGLAITRNGAGGTTTNLLNLTNTAGTATNAISISGTFTNLINAPNLVVTNAGNADFAGTLTAGASDAFQVDASGALVAGSITSGFGSIDTGADNITTTGTVQGGIVNAATGFRVNGAATTGNYLRGNGTNFVSSALLASDLSGTIFSNSADSNAGTNTVVTGDTVSILGGTNGIDTSLNGDTYTINLDTTEIGTTTFGAGSGFTWTFDAGATDPTIAFASDALTVTAAATTFSGDLAVNGGNLTSTSSLNVTASNGALTLTSTGSGNDVVINSADTIELQDTTNITGSLNVTSNIDTNGTLTVGNSNQFTVNATGAITAATGITSSGSITFSGLTADRLVATTTGGQLTNTITAANLAASVTGTTGTGNLVFSASPTFTGTVTTAAISATTVTTSGILTVGALGTTNTDAVLCYNSSNQIAACNSTFATAPVSGTFIRQVPTTTAENTITPTANSVVGLTVNGTSGTAATAASIVQAGGALALNITSSSTGDGQNINLTNTSGTQTNGLAITRNGAGGTTTNLLNLTNTAGTVTNGINFSGAYTNLITSSVFNVTNGGTVSASNSFDRIGASGTLGIGSSVATTLNIGSNGANNPAINIDSGTSAINIGTGAQARTINLGTGAAAQALTLGSTNGASTTTIQGGSGGIVFNSSLLSRTAAGTTTFDLIDGSATTFAITNSGAGVANLTTDGNADFAGTLTAGTSDAFQVNASGALIAGSITSGFGSIDTGADNITTTGTVQGGIVNATTGFQVAGAATTGNYLRGNGTNFVSSALLASDLSGTIFSNSADSNAGTNTIVTGDTLSIQGGTNGIDTSLSGDTYTLNLDTTEIGTTTFGSGTDFTWTFNPAGATNPTIAFTNDALNVTAGTSTFTGGLAVTGSATFDGNVTIGNANTDTLTITGTAVSIPNNLNFDSNTLFIDAANNRVGIGENTADYKLDIRTTGSGATQLHVASANADSGGYLTSASASNFFMSAGVAWNGTNWIAKSTTAGNAGFNNGAFSISTNSGLTAGGSYTPTSRFAVDTSGNVNISGLTASRLVATDGSKNLVSTIAAADLLSSVTGTTGTGNLVFSASPTFTGTVTAAAINASGNVDVDGTFTQGSAGQLVVDASGNIDTTGNIEGTVLNATTGFRVNGAATTGNYLRGNGTNFVSSALLASDLSGTIFSNSADSNAGTNTIVTGDTLSIQGGTNGIDTSLNNDTYTINLDTTEIGTTTFGAGSAFTWTFDASAGTDTVIVFGNDAITLGSATTGVTFNSAGAISDVDGNLVLNDQTDIGSTTTGLRVTTAGAISDIDGSTVDINDGLTVAGSTTISATGSSALLVQNSGATETALSVDTAVRGVGGGNLVKIGNSTGTDTATTLLQLDSTTAAVTSNLSALNGGLYYFNGNGTGANARIQGVINSTVYDLCTTQGNCTGGAGGVGGTGTDNQIAIFSGTSTLDSSANFTFDASGAGTFAVNAITNINTSGSNGINIGTGTYSGTVAIGNSASTTTVLGATNINNSGNAATTIGNTSGTATVDINGGTGAGAVSIQAAATGTISLGTTNANTINIGNNGSTNATNITAGSGNINLQANTVVAANQSLSLASGTGTFSQTYTGTTTTAATITASSLTSGKALSVTSAATGLTGNLVDITLTGNNAGNTGTLLHVSNGNNASNANTLVAFTNGGTGLSLRVNDDGTDTDSTAFVVDASGNVGIKTTTPSGAILDVNNGNNVSSGNVANFYGNATGNAADQKGIQSYLYVNPGSASTQTYFGQDNFVYLGNANSATAGGYGTRSVAAYGAGSQLTGALIGGSFGAQNQGAGNIDNATGLIAGIQAQSTGIITNGVGIRVQAASGTVTNNTGIYVENQTAGTTSDYGVYIQGADTYALFVDSGITRLDGQLTIQGVATDITTTGNEDLTLDAAGTGLLQLSDSVVVAANQYLKLTGGSTANRPSSPTAGMLYYDTSTNQLLTYNGTKWMADKSTAIIVAPSGATDAQKAAADYVADGNGAGAGDGDQVEINAALTAASGGKVYLLPGTYVADATIFVPNNTTLAGAGRGTIIELADLDATDNLIENTDATTGTGITIRDLKLDGRSDLNTAGNQNGINLTNMGDNSTYRVGGQLLNLWIERFRTSGVAFATSDLNTVSGVVATGSASSTFGFSLDSSQNNTFTGNTAQYFSAGFYAGSSSNQNTFTGNTAASNVANGMTLGSGGNTVTGNTFAENGGNGIYLNFGSGNAVTGNLIRQNALHGISIDTANNNVVSGNSMYNNGGSGSSSSIFLVDADTNHITGNRMTDTAGTGYAINVSNAASDNTYLADNTYSGTGATSINNAGTGTIFGGQLSGNNYTIQPAGTIELVANTNVTGTLGVTGTVTLGDDTLDITTTTNEDLTVVANGTGIIDLNDTVRVGTLAAADSDSYVVCRDASSGQLSACDANTSGDPFIQGGNSFGAQAVLGTNDANSLAFETNNNTRFVVDAAASTLTGQGTTILTSTGSLTVSSAAASTLSIDSGTTGAINIGTSANAKTITIGNTTGATGVAINTGSGNFAVNTDDIFVQQSSGRVAIGTTSVDANAQLTVSGNVRAQSYFTGAGGLIAFGATPNDVYTDNDSAFEIWQNSGSDQLEFYAAPAGTAGNPTAYNFALGILTDGSLNVGVGLVGANPVIDWNHFDVSAAGGITFTGVATDITTAAGENLTVTTGTTGSITLDTGTTGAIDIGTGANGKAITIGNTTANTSVSIKTGGTGNFAVNTDDLVVETATGFVGIGVSSSLQGNLDIRQISNGDTVLYARRNTDSSPTGNFLHFQNAAANADVLKLTTQGILTVTAKASGVIEFKRDTVTDPLLSINTSSGRVGVGVATFGQNARLHVSSATAAEDLFRITDSTATALDVFNVADEGAVTIRTRTDSLTGLQVMDADGGTPVLNVDTINERVGIGTSAPAASLQVAGGSVLLDNNQAYRQYDVGGTSRAILNLTGGDVLELTNNSGGDGGEIQFVNKTGGASSLSLSATGNLTFQQSSTITTLGSGSIALTTGGTGSASGATSVTTGAGTTSTGILTLQSGNASAGVSGNVTLGSGTGTTGSGTVTIATGSIAGSPTTTVSSGALGISTSNGGSNSTNSGTAGASGTVTIATGNGGAETGTNGTGGTAGTLSLTAGNGGAGTGTNGTGGALTLQAGNGGAGTGARAAGGAITVTGGSASTSGTGSAAGGALTLQGGAAGGASANGGAINIAGGTGAGTGYQGLINLATTAFNTSTQVNAGAGTTSLGSSYVDVYSTIPVNASSATAIVSIADPGISTIGRVLYVTAINGSTDFTLRLNAASTPIDIAMKANSTATLIWNGTRWTAAGASSSTDLQSAYNNTLTSAGGAEIVLNSPGGNADGFTIRNNGTTPISGGILEVQSSIGTNLFSVNNLGTELASNGGAETTSTFTTNWTAAPVSATIAQTSTSGEYVTGRFGVRATTTTTQYSGVRNNLSGNPVASTTYTVSFTAKSNAVSTPIDVQYSYNGGTNLTACTSYSSQTLTNSNWTKITCTITTPSNAVTDPDLIIRKTDTSSPIIYIDNLSFIRNDSTTQPSNVQIGGGINGGPITLFTLDRASAPPVANGDTTFLGSMYYDTTTGRIQCYESDGWGACGSAPDNIITLTPEYTGAVLNGSGVGTMTADFCANETSVLVVGSLCANHEARNFYRWTSPQATSQTYSVYVTYKLPTTFKTFYDANTIKLTAYKDHATNAGATLEVYRKNVSGSTITQCGSTTTITTGTSAWNQTSLTGDETACGWSGGDYVIFKINVTASNNANVYVENLDFTFMNQ